MSGSFGGTVKLQGESEYRKALRDITSNLKLVSSELKLTDIQFVNGDNTLKQTKSSYKSMQTTLEEQKEKVSNLRNALKEAEVQYGSNNEKVKQFKTQLNNAEVQLKQMEDATDKSNKELKDMKNNFNDAGSGALKFGDILKANVIGDVITSGLKAVGTAVKEIGKSFIDIGQQAVNSFGDFEQLEGGVKKLFGDEMAQSVINNANNAFQTAGMNANEYMDTVTGFSASLITSLGGDTKKAVGYADTAIRDMSDNANTFGTDITSIQNAYQGFAKQNYTMLDNLKLGYGGTKTEMQRLLEDASKISGIKYDISSFADITQAIHVMQEQMNIAGTTYKEASGTIQGSISAMKSSWQNLLTGLATGNTDLGGLLNNLVEGVITTLDNIMPVIENVADNIVAMLPEVLNKIIENLPKFLETGQNILNKVIEGLTNNMPAIMTAVTQILNTLTTTIIQNLPQILEMGIQLIVSLAQGIAEQLPTLIPQMVDAIITMVETLLDNIDLIIDAGIQLLLGLADGLIEALPILIEKIPEIIQKVFDALIENFPKIVQAGGELIGKLLSGITGSFWKILEVAPQLISNIINGLKQGWEEIKNIGKYLVEGLWNGISGMASWVYEKITSFAKNIVGNIKNALGIHSPSAVLRDQVGKFMAQGIGLGFENEMGNVTRQMQDAIPTKFDVESTISSNNSLNSNQNLKDALVAAFKEFKPSIILNEKEIGEFAFEYGNVRFGNYI